jgi:hypothetical protein
VRSESEKWIQLPESWRFQLRRVETFGTLQNTARSERLQEKVVLIQLFPNGRNFFRIWRLATKGSLFRMEIEGKCLEVKQREERNEMNGCGWFENGDIRSTVRIN